MQALDNWLAKATGVTCHSANVLPGYIFVAIRGRRTDGNAFARAASERGALAIVTDCPDALPPLSVPVFAVSNARLALSALASSYYQNPSHQLQLTGVTGSNGKTTIACMLEHIFKTTGLTTGIIGTVRVNTGKSSIPSTLTTPDAVNLQHYLAQMVANKVTHAVMEVSAQGIDMQRAHHVRFSAGILSNICPDHLDFHGNFDNYLTAKSEFLNLLSQDTPLIANIADPYCQTIVAAFAGRLITAAVGCPADIRADITRMTPYGSSFILMICKPLTMLNGETLSPGRFIMNIPIPGRHNIENALLAATAALLHNVTPSAIARSLENFRGVERRMDVFHLAGLTVVDDTALNPGSIQALFDTLSGFSCRRLVVINAIRGRRGTAINAANAATLASLQHRLPFRLLVTDSSDTVGFADKVTPEERLAFLKTLTSLNTDYAYTSNLATAIETVLKQTGAGDLVVLMGAQGMDAGRQLLQAAIHTQNSFQEQILQVQFS